ncbi:MAG: hypothetical protein HRU15_18320, partial [Planctomycetes bacterium]|nr:hypothetical protein [Planctomycetota bacterium]
MARAQNSWQIRYSILGLLMTCLSPLLVVYIIWRLLIQRRKMVGLKQKLLGDHNHTKTTGLIMVHGVSMGEVMLMKPVVPLIQQACNTKCLLTTSTSTGASALQKNFPNNHKAFFPFDFPWAINNFLNQYKPSMIILLELELWPLFLCACFARNIPVLLLNARVGESSFQSYQRYSTFLQPIFSQIQCAVAQNALWGGRLQQLGFTNVQLGASLKADIIQPANKEQIAAERQRLSLSTDPVFLIASSSDGEEELLIKSWLTWGSDWQLIICPRHPERGAAIKKLCEQLQLHPQQSSLTGGINNNSGVSIVDEIGRLAALYGERAGNIILYKCLVGVVVYLGNLTWQNGGNHPGKITANGVY